MKQQFSIFWNTCIARHKYAFIFMTAMSILSQLCFLGTPLVTAKIIDFATEHAGRDFDLQFFTFLIVLQFVVYCIGSISYQLCRYVADVLRIQIPLEFKGKVLDTYLSRDLEEIERRDNLRIVEVATNSAQALSSLIYYYSKYLFDNIITVVMGFAVFFSIDPMLAIIFTAYVVIVSISQSFFNVKISRGYRPLLDEHEKNMSKIIEGLLHFRTLRFLGLRAGLVQNVEQLADNATDEGRRITKIARTKWTLLSLSNILLYSAGFSYIGYKIALSQITPGVIVIFAAYSQKLMSSLEIISIEFENFIKYFHTLSRALDLFSWNAERGGPLLPNQIHGSVRVEELRFAYRTRSESDEATVVLDDVSFQIQAGEKVAVLGRSGSGKSTLFQVLTGSYPGYGGRIFFGDQALSELDHLSHMQKVLYIPQITELFHATLRENVLLGREDDEDVYYRALELAHCSFLEQLEQGDDTLIGNKGALLSGGEGQRVGLARVFMRKDLDVLMFDEATSQLDVETSRHVLRSILEQYPETTLLYATHRLNELQWFDRVLYFERGVLAYDGPREGFDLHQFEAAEE